MWKEIERLAGIVTTGYEKFRDYLRVSSFYGRIKYQIIQQAWIVMLKDLEADMAHRYDNEVIQTAFLNYEIA
jgi:hypothetical protein